MFFFVICDHIRRKKSIMAKRYRYSFTKKKEAAKGKLSAGLAVTSCMLFIIDVVLAYSWAAVLDLL